MLRFKTDDNIREMCIKYVTYIEIKRTNTRHVVNDKLRFRSFWLASFGSRVSFFLQVAPINIPRIDTSSLVTNVERLYNEARRIRGS